MRRADRKTRAFQSQLRRSRIALYSVALPVLGLSLFGVIDSALRLLYILLGFSLIIFLHELGHFLVARWCSVKCLAFSIGIGPRMCGWRKGGRFSFGKDPYDTENAKPSSKSGTEKTLGEREDNKYALKPVEGGQVVHGEKGPVTIQPDTPDLTADILGKPHKHAPAATQSDLPTTAHAPPHPRNVGDCDYRVSWLPLGGYVRMLGQDDMDPAKISDDPNSFNRRPIWQRMCIVSAGVIMNLIFAAVVFSIIFSPGLGVDFPPAVIGKVEYGMPGWDKLQMGDEVIEINGEKITRGKWEFTDLMMTAALSSGAEEIKLKVLKASGGEATYSILPKRSDQTGFLALGIEPMPGTKLGFSLYTEDEKNMLRALDPAYQINLDAAKSLEEAKETFRITKVDDVQLQEAPDPTPPGFKYPFQVFYEYIQNKGDQPIKLTLVGVKNRGLTKEVTIVPHLERRSPNKVEFPPVFGLTPRIALSAPEPITPAAKAGFLAGDRVVKVGDKNYPSSAEMIKIIKESGGEEVKITVERVAPGTASTAPGSLPAVAERIELPVKPELMKGVYRIGVGIYDEMLRTSFRPAEKETAVGAMNLSPEAQITAIDGVDVKNWPDIYREVRNKEPGKEVKVTFNRGDGSEPVTVALALSADEFKAARSLLHYEVGLQLEHQTFTQRAANPGQAVLMGMDHTKKFILQVYMTLAGLFRQTISPENLHGIVGITKIGYDVQERGMIWLWYVLAMVSVNLAVANFLPLPIVDGGLFLLLILEKIRGKPLSLKVQSAIQVVGIVLLAGLFLFVTYNDIWLFVK